MGLKTIIAKILTKKALLGGSVGLLASIGIAGGAIAPAVIGVKETVKRDEQIAVYRAAVAKYMDKMYPKPQPSIIPPAPAPAAGIGFTAQPNVMTEAEVLTAIGSRLGVFTIAGNPITATTTGTGHGPIIATDIPTGFYLKTAGTQTTFAKITSANYPEKNIFTNGSLTTTTSIIGYNVAAMNGEFTPPTLPKGITSVVLTSLSAPVATSNALTATYTITVSGGTTFTKTIQVNFLKSPNAENVELFTVANGTKITTKPKVLTATEILSYITHPTGLTGATITDITPSTIGTLSQDTKAQTFKFHITLGGVKSVKEYSITVEFNHTPADQTKVKAWENVTTTFTLPSPKHNITSADILAGLKALSPLSALTSSDFEIVTATSGGVAASGTGLVLGSTFPVGNHTLTFNIKFKSGALTGTSKAVTINFTKSRSELLTEQVTKIQTWLTANHKAGTVAISAFTAQNFKTETSGQLNAGISMTAVTATALSSGDAKTRDYQYSLQLKDGTTLLATLATQTGTVTFGESKNDKIVTSVTVTPNSSAINGAPTATVTAATIRPLLGALNGKTAKITNIVPTIVAGNKAVSVTFDVQIGTSKVVQRTTTLTYQFSQNDLNSVTNWANGAKTFNIDDSALGVRRTITKAQIIAGLGLTGLATANFDIVPSTSTGVTVTTTGITIDKNFAQSGKTISFTASFKSNAKVSAVLNFTITFTNSRQKILNDKITAYTSTMIATLTTDPKLYTVDMFKVKLNGLLSGSQVSLEGTPTFTAPTGDVKSIVVTYGIKLSDTTGTLPKTLVTKTGLKLTINFDKSLNKHMVDALVAKSAHPTLTGKTRDVTTAELFAKSVLTTSPTGLAAGSFTIVSQSKPANSKEVIVVYTVTIGTATSPSLTTTFNFDYSQHTHDLITNWDAKTAIDITDASFGVSRTIDKAALIAAFGFITPPVAGDFTISSVGTQTGVSVAADAITINKDFPSTSNTVKFGILFAKDGKTSSVHTVTITFAHTREWILKQKQIALTRDIQTVVVADPKLYTVGMFVTKLNLLLSGTHFEIVGTPSITTPATGNGKAVTFTYALGLKDSAPLATLSGQPLTVKFQNSKNHYDVNAITATSTIPVLTGIARTITTTDLASHLQVLDFTHSTTKTLDATKFTGLSTVIDPATKTVTVTYTISVGTSTKQMTSKFKFAWSTNSEALVNTWDGKTGINIADLTGVGVSRTITKAQIQTALGFSSFADSNFVISQSGPAQTGVTVTASEITVGDTFTKGTQTVNFDVQYNKDGKTGVKHTVTITFGSTRNALLTAKQAALTTTIQTLVVQTDPKDYTVTMFKTKLNLLLGANFEIVGTPTITTAATPDGNGITFTYALGLKDTTGHLATLSGQTLTVKFAKSKNNFAVNAITATTTVHTLSGVAKDVTAAQLAAVVSALLTQPLPTGISTIAATQFKDITTAFTANNKQVVVSYNIKVGQSTTTTKLSSTFEFGWSKEDELKVNGWATHLAITLTDADYGVSETITKDKIKAALVAAGVAGLTNANFVISAPTTPITGTTVTIGDTTVGSTFTSTGKTVNINVKYTLRNKQSVVKHIVITFTKSRNEILVARQSTLKAAIAGITALTTDPKDYTAALFKTALNNALTETRFEVSGTPTFTAITTISDATSIEFTYDLQLKGSSSSTTLATLVSQTAIINFGKSKNQHSLDALAATALTGLAGMPTAVDPAFIESHKVALFGSTNVPPAGTTYRVTKTPIVTASKDISVEFIAQLGSARKTFTTTFTYLWSVQQHNTVTSWDALHTISMTDATFGVSRVITKQQILDTLNHTLPLGVKPLTLANFVISQPTTPTVGATASSTGIIVDGTYSATPSIATAVTFDILYTLDQKVGTKFTITINFAQSRNDILVAKQALLATAIQSPVIVTNPKTYDVRMFVAKLNALFPNSNYEIIGTPTRQAPGLDDQTIVFTYALGLKASTNKLATLTGQTLGVKFAASINSMALAPITTNSLTIPGKPPITFDASYLKSLHGQDTDHPAFLTTLPLLPQPITLNDLTYAITNYTKDDTSRIVKFTLEFSKGNAHVKRNIVFTYTYSENDHNAVQGWTASTKAIHQTHVHGVPAALTKARILAILTTQTEFTSLTDANFHIVPKALVGGVTIATTGITIDPTYSQTAKQLVFQLTFEKALKVGVTTATAVKQATITLNYAKSRKDILDQKVKDIQTKLDGLIQNTQMIKPFTESQLTSLIGITSPFSISNVHIVTGFLNDKLKKHFTYTLSLTEAGTVHAHIDIQPAVVTFAQSDNQNLLDALVSTNIHYTPAELLKVAPLSVVKTDFHVGTGTTQVTHTTITKWAPATGQTDQFDRTKKVQTGTVSLLLGTATKDVSGVVLTFTKRNQEMTSFKTQLSNAVFTGIHTHLFKIDLNKISSTYLSDLTTKELILSYSIDGGTTFVPITSSLTSVAHIDPARTSIKFRFTGKDSTIVVTNTSVGVPATVPETTKEIDFLTTIPRFVIVTQAMIQGVAFGGNTHAMTIAEGRTTIKTGIKIQYTLTDGNAPTLAIAKQLGFTSIPSALKPWMSKAELIALLITNGKSLTYFDGSNWVKMVVKARYLTTDAAKFFVDPTKSEISTSNVVKWANVEQDFTKIDQVVFNDGKTDGDSDSDWIKWNSHMAIMIPELNARGLAFEFSISETGTPGTFTRITSATTVDGQITVNTESGKRHLFVKVVKLGTHGTDSTMILSKPNHKDITTSSHIQLIQSRVAMTMYAAGGSSDLTTGITLDGDTKAIVKLTQPTIDSYLEFVYSIDNGVTWKLWADFKADASTKVFPNIYKMADIKVGVRVKTGQPWRIRVLEKLNVQPDTSALLFYKNIDEFKALLNIPNGDTYAGSVNHAGISLTGEIELIGQVGLANGAAFVISQNIKTKYEALGLELQFRIKTAAATFGDWTSVSLGSVTLQGATKQNAQLTTLFDLNNDGIPYLAFRLVPVKDEAGHVAKPSAGEQSWLKYQEASKVYTTDSVGLTDTVTGPTYQVDTTQIPIFVTTDHAVLSHISFSGDVRHLTILEQLDGSGKTAQQYIKDMNKGNDYYYDGTKPANTQGIDIRYNFKDGIPAHDSLWLRKDNFIKFLKFGLPITIHGVATKTTPNPVDFVVPGTTTAPNWNAIDFSSFRIKWATMKAKTAPSDSTEYTVLPTELANLKKWVDVSTILTKLKQMIIKGDTKHMTSTDLAAFKTELDNLPKNTVWGSDKVEIQLTNKKLSSGHPDWSVHTTNALPANLADERYLALRIVTISAGSTPKYVVSMFAHATPGTDTSEEIVWNQVPSVYVPPTAGTPESGLKTWVDVDQALLNSKVTLTGNTFDVQVGITDGTLTTLDFKHVIGATSHKKDALELWFRLAGTGIDSTYNMKAMPQSVFIEYLSHKLIKNGTTITTASGTDVTSYGFTVANYLPKHNGKWDKANIQVAFHAKNGFTIDTRFEANTNFVTAFKVATASSVKQYINIDKLVAPTATPTKGLIFTSINLDKSNGNGFAGYLDSKHLVLTVDPLILSPTTYDSTWNYGSGFFYSFEKAKPSATDTSKWTEWDATHKPTEIKDKNRGFWVMFKPTATSIMLSDGYAGGAYAPHIYNLAGQTDIDNKAKLPININTQAVHLDKIALSGLTNAIIVTDMIDAVIPNAPVNHAKQHATIMYSLNNFGNVTSDATLAKKMGFATMAAAITAGFKDHFNKAEFIAFVLKGNIKRHMVKVQLFANTDYGILPSDKTATLKDITLIDDLYTYLDTNGLAEKLKLTGETATSAVEIQGRIGDADGVMIQLPDTYGSAALALLGLKLQFTTTPTPTTTSYVDSSSYLTMKIAPTAVWKDLSLTSLTNAGKNSNLTTPAGFLGQLLTLKKTSNYAFIALRLVPIKDDKKTTNNVADENIFKQFIEANKTKTSDWLAFPTPADRNGAYYSIDTSKIPTTIFTHSANLATIALTGDTRHISIAETFNGQPALQSISQIADNLDTSGNFDSKYLGEVEILYSIDSYKSPTNVDTKIWLKKADFIAYLQGTLTMTGTKVMNGSSEVVTLTNAKRTVPDYLEIDKDQIFARWAIKDIYKKQQVTGFAPKFAPSDKGPQKVVTTDGTFKKWFNAVEYKAQIIKIIVSGDTHSYVMGTEAQLWTKAAFLTKHNLKMQYSNDDNAYTDLKFDFNKVGVTWETIRDKKLYIKIVPIEPTQVVINGPDQSGQNAKYPKGPLRIGNKDLVTGHFIFKTYLNLLSNELIDATKGVEFTGTTFEFFKLGNIAKGLNEQRTDSDTTQYNAAHNVSPYSQVRIEYLYDGHWYTKANLLAQMKIHTDAVRAGNADAFTVPTDFSKNSIQLKWVVEDVTRYVIKTNQDDAVVADNSLNDTFTNWVNVFAYQKRPTDAITTLAGFTRPFTQFQDGTLTTDTTKPGAGSGTTSITLQGDLKLLTFDFQATGIFGALGDSATVSALYQANFLNKGIKIQYSIADTPSQKLGGSGWIDGWPKDLTTINSKTRQLWMRIVPTDVHRYSVSTSFRGTGGRDIVPIKVDTSAVLYSIKVTGSKLTGLMVSGNTQKYAFDNLQTVLLSTYNNVDQAIKTGDVANEYIFAVVKVVATRTKGNYVAGQTYIFTKQDLAFTATPTLPLKLPTGVAGMAGMKQFREDVLKGDLNFLPSKLEVSLRVKDAQSLVNKAFDEAWYKPNVGKLQAFIYTKDHLLLDENSIVVAGNNLKMVVDVPATGTKLDPVALKALGLKIQYDIIDKTKALAMAPGSVNNWKDLFDIEVVGGVAPTWKSTLFALKQHKTLFIRYAPINEKLTGISTTNKYIISGAAPAVLDTTNPEAAVDGRQVTKIKVDAVKVAIVLARDAYIRDVFQKLIATGGTAFFDGTHALPADLVSIIEKFNIHLPTEAKDLLGVDYALPKVGTGTTGDFPANAGASSHKPEDYIRFEFAVKPIDNAVGTYDKYIYNVLQDAYGKGFRSLNKDRDEALFVHIVIPTAKQQFFQITDAKGDPFDQTADLEKQIAINNLVQPVYLDTHISTIASRTWDAVSSDSKFRPEFKRGSTSKTAIIKSVTFDGAGLTSTGEEVYKLNSNFFFPTDASKTLSRRSWDALAPLHTHFEFSFLTGNTWSAPTIVPPTNELITSTRYKGIKLTLVLGDVNKVSNIVDDHNYVIIDPSNVKQKGFIWTKTFNVILIKDTSKFVLDNMEFLGFSDNSKPVAVVKRDNLIDPNKGDQIIEFTSGTGGASINFLPKVDSAFTIEYKVTDVNGMDKPWTDEAGVTAPGWHILTTPPKTDGATYTPYGSSPTSLVNGDRVWMRLRANDGWVLRDSGAPIQTQNGLLERSQVFKKDVAGLKILLKFPTGMRVFDSEITNNVKTATSQYTTGDVLPAQMPRVTFTGIDGRGVITYTPGTYPGADHMEARFQILRPWLPSAQTHDPIIEEEKNAMKNGFAKYGYEIILKDGTKKVVFVTEKGTTYAITQHIATGSTGGWLENVQNIKNSWWTKAELQASTRPDVYVGDALNFRYVAKTGYAFKWEDTTGAFQYLNGGKLTRPFADIWVPKETSNGFFNDPTPVTVTVNSNPVTRVLQQVIVKGLTIKPPYLASEITLEYDKVPTGVGSAYYPQPFNHVAKPKVDKAHASTPKDKWEWIFSSTETGAYGKAETLTTLQNGDIVWIKAKIKGKYTGVAFDSLYTNIPHKFIVTGLKNFINTEDLKKREAPKLVFVGNEGAGTISKALIWDVKKDALGPIIIGGATEYPIDKIHGTFEIPKHVATDVLNGVKWQYQLSRKNVLTQSKVDLRNLPWTDTVPTDLKVGYYVRMRLTAIDPLDTVYPAVYSHSTFDPITSKYYFDEGWVKVEALGVQSANIQVKPLISGYNQLVSFNSKFAVDNIDSKAVIILAHVRSRSSASTATDKSKDALWYRLNEMGNVFTGTSHNQLMNGDVIEYRIIAKPGFVLGTPNADIDVNGKANKVPSYQKQTLAKTPADGWQETIHGLKEYLNVNALSIKDLFQVRSEIHPQTPMKVDPADPTKQIPLTDDEILSGYATISTDKTTFLSDALVKAVDSWINKADKVFDIGDKQIANAVKIVFTVQKFDPDTGRFIELKPSEEPPKNLKNLDIVKIQVVPTDEAKYKLSDDISKSITIKNLIQEPPKLNQPPSLLFQGKNGLGTVVVTPIAEKRFKWTYNVQKQGTTKTDIFTSEVPTHLSNGDLVRVQLESTVPGITAQSNFRTPETLVTGLTDLLNFGLINIDNKDKILRVVGKQSGNAEVIAKAPSTLTANGLPLPQADQLAWRYAIVKQGDKHVPTSYSEFGLAVPKGLENGDKVYALLASTNPDIKLLGAPIVSIEVKNLEPKGSISGAMSIAVYGALGGLLVVGAAGSLIFMRRQKHKKLL